MLCLDAADLRRLDCWTLISRLFCMGNGGLGKGWARRGRRRSSGASGARWRAGEAVGDVLAPPLGFFVTPLVLTPVG